VAATSNSTRKLLFKDVSPGVKYFIVYFIKRPRVRFDGAVFEHCASKPSG